MVSTGRPVSAASWRSFAVLIPCRAASRATWPPSHATTSRPPLRSDSGGVAVEVAL
jgi:hypothetical protein